MLLYELSSLTKQTVSDVEEWRRIRGEQDLAYEEALLIDEAKVSMQSYKNVNIDCDRKKLLLKLRKMTDKGKRFVEKCTYSEVLI